jgi:hypothetical protein
MTSLPQVCECGAHKVKDSSHALWCPCSAKKNELPKIYIKPGYAFIDNPEKALKGKFGDEK